MYISKAHGTSLSAIIDSIYGLVGLGVTGEMDLSDAPNGDLNLDEIFGDSQGTRTTEPLTTTDPAAATQTTTPAEPFIKTKTGTVYKTAGDAVEGIEHKDALIAQLREQVRNNTGHDPLVVSKPNANQPVNYVVDQDKYFEDIAKAVDAKNTKAYMEVQQKFMWDTLGPIAPTITALSRANAERVVAEQHPDFKGFLNSDQYQTIGQSSPLLADAIKAAESNPAAASQLPELYRIAFLASQGSRVPELIQSAQHQTVPVTPRPTVQSTQLPPPPTNQNIAQPGLSSTEGRKAMIEKAEAGGILNLKW